MELKILGVGGGHQRRMMKESRAEAPGLEKPQVIRGLLYGEDGSVVVDLLNLGAQLILYLDWRFTAIRKEF